MTGESILVVEDDGFIALSIRELLERNGYQVSGMAAYGEDAVILAEQDPPDLICMDIELMGNTDGIEAARKIHEHAEIPIIYLTAYADSERLARAKETGPYSYVVKPFNERELLAAIEIALHRQKIDRQLQESMQRYRAIIDYAAEGILLVSSDTQKIVEANPALIRLLGYSAKEITGLTIDEIMVNRDTMAGQTGTVICSPQGPSVETRFRCRDGSLREIELTTSSIHRKGSPDLTCMIAHDVTDRKHAETALREAHRKLNLLSSVTRHDILNQLTVLYGFLEISGAALAGTRLEKYVEKEKNAAIAIRRMISFTKDYEEIGQQRPGWHRPDAIIRQVTKTINFPDIPIDCRLGTLELFADPLLERVFHNLLDNAIRHGEHVKTITVTSESTDRGLLIRWEDDGTGIPDAEKERIFERGYGKHTGLGLFLAREILSLTGITIRETGIFGTGARFELMVPAGMYRYPQEDERNS
ncbi:MAG: response regulator [Methanoregulaceae archaeon]|nr:MAG: response regulator [Methanoregulaceae archaeon]